MRLPWPRVSNLRSSFAFNADSTLISNLSREHNVKILFRRFPDQGRVGIILSGAPSNLASAREEVESLSEVRQLSALFL